MKANFNRNTDTVSAIDEVLRLGIRAIDNGCNDLRDFIIGLSSEAVEIEASIKSLILKRNLGIRYDFIYYQSRNKKRCCLAIL